MLRGIGINAAMASLTFSSWRRWCTEEDRRYSVMGGIGLEPYRMALANVHKGMPRVSRCFCRPNRTKLIVISSRGTSLLWAKTNNHHS